MDKVSLIRYSPDSNDSLLTAKLVECYRGVFADEPWNEWLKCQRCQKFWGTRDSGLLAATKFRHCDEPLVDFWPRDQVVADIYHEITPKSSCWLAVSGDIVVGFCWGYPITVPDLEEKLGISLNSNLGTNGLIAYQDEVGVAASHRGKKIAKAMVLRRLCDFLSQNLTVGVVRTRQYPEPSQTFLWYTEKLGYRILVNYPGDDGRVVLGRKLDGLDELLISQ